MKQGLLHTLLVGGSLVAAVCVWVHGSSRMTHAREVALGARRTAAALADLTTLESLPARVAPAPESAGLLIGRVQQALSAAGLPPDVLTQIVPGEPAPVAAAPALAQREVRAILSGVSLAELGTFFDVWRQAEPACVITSVSIAPLGVACSREPDARAITVTLALRSTFFRQAGGPQ